MSLHGSMNGDTAQQLMKRSNRKLRSSFSTSRGLILSVSIGVFVALIFVLVYYVYILPMQRSLE
jgi:hypothetical protein